MYLLLCVLYIYVNKDKLLTLLEVKALPGNENISNESHMK